MELVGTIEVTQTTSKTREVSWWSTWTEVGNRAMYQTDADAERAVIKALLQLRKLAEVPDHVNLDFEVFPLESETPGVLIRATRPALRLAEAS